MKHAQLTIQKRNLLGHKARKLRRDGIVPAVIYSKKYPSTNVQVEQKSFYAVFKHTGHTGVIELDLDGANVPAIVHELDIDPVKGSVRHIDFLVVNLKEKVKATVPIEFVGISTGVKDLGAVLSVNLDELDIEALPDNIPSKISIDISSLIEISDYLSVADIFENEKYEILNDPEQVIVSLVEGATGIEENSAPEQVIPDIAVEADKTDESK